ncbi:hypothetical protein BH09VER1_BH09VER1_37560 [soil metagenome]
MIELQNTRHETFAQFMAVGATKVHAYAAAFPQAGWGTANCKGSALARRADVAARISVLLTEGTREAVWQLSARLEYLRAVALIPYSALSEESPYCNGVRRTRRGIVYRMPDKLAAVRLYSRLAGDLGPTLEEKRDPTASPTSALFPAESAPVCPDWLDIPAWRTHQAARDLTAQQIRLAEYLQPRPDPHVLQILTNARHERFAHLVGSGQSIADAYQQIYRAPRETALSQGYRVAHRPDVARRIALIQGHGTRAVAWPLIERLRYLKAIATTRYDDLTMDSCYCQAIRRNCFGISLRMPDKMQAVELYSRLNGDLKKIRSSPL